MARTGERSLRAMPVPRLRAAPSDAQHTVTSGAARRRQQPAGAARCQGQVPPGKTGAAMRGRWVTSTAILFALAACASTGAVFPSGAPLGVDGARLLLTRTGFGAAPAELAAFAPLTREQAVDRLLASTDTRAVTPVPPILDDPASMKRPGRDATDDERKAYRRQQRDAALALRAWWLHEMLVTPSPLTERMTLFWHGHFATSVQ